MTNTVGPQHDLVSELQVHFPHQGTGHVRQAFRGCRDLEGHNAWQHFRYDRFCALYIISHAIGPGNEKSLRESSVMLSKKKAFILSHRIPLFFPSSHPRPPSTALSPLPSLSIEQPLQPTPGAANSADASRLPPLSDEIPEYSGCHHLSYIGTNDQRTEKVKEASESTYVLLPSPLRNLPSSLSQPYSLSVIIHTQPHTFPFLPPSPSSLNLTLPPKKK